MSGPLPQILSHTHDACCSPWKQSHFNVVLLTHLAQSLPFMEYLLWTKLCAKSFASIFCSSSQSPHEGGTTVTSRLQAKAQRGSTPHPRTHSRWGSWDSHSDHCESWIGTVTPSALWPLSEGPCRAPAATASTTLKGQSSKGAFHCKSDVLCYTSCSPMFKQL